MPMRSRPILFAAAFALSLAACKDKAPPPPVETHPDPKPTAVAATASASPADLAAAATAYDAYKKRLDDIRGLLLPYRDNKKKAPPCRKTSAAEPALLIDNDHSFSNLRVNHSPHWGRVAAPLEIVNYTGFLESDKKELRDSPFDPKAALAALGKINATQTTIFIDVEETRPVVDGEAYRPGKAKGTAYVVDSKKTVCVVPIDHVQSGKVKYESLVFENDPDFNALDKQASASVAVEYAYDFAIASQVVDALTPLGWTSILGPRAPKK